jgi:hypothetical protein
MPPVVGEGVPPSYPRLESGAERADDGLVMFPAPWYVRLVGWILAAFGAFHLAGFVWASPALLGVDPFVLTAVVLFGVVPLVGGIGTIASRRWGWIMSFVALTVGILFGIAAWVFEGVASIVSPTAEGLELGWTWLTFLVLPGLAMLGALLAPATLRWLRTPPTAA